MGPIAQPTERSGRLPSDLYTVYAQYKKDTQSIIQWLVQYGTPTDKEAKCLALRDIKRLIDVVCNESLPKPRAIKYHFEAAISARQKITRFFKATSPADSLATSTHEFFTHSLVEMYNSLFPDILQFGDHDVVGTSQIYSGRALDHVNRLQNLELDASTEESSSSRETLSSQIAPPSAVTTIAGQVEKEHSPRIVGDSLGDVLELFGGIRDKEDLRRASFEAWEQTAEGTIPRVVATFVTNAAFAVAKPIQQRLQETFDDPNPEILKERLLQIQQSESVFQTGKDTPDPTILHMIEDLLTSWTVLKQSKKDGKARAKQGFIVERPTDFYGDQHPENYHTDQESLSRLLQNIKDRSRDDINVPYFSDWTLPLVSEITSFLQEDKYTDQGLKHSVGLLLMNQSYKAFLSIPTETGKTPNCRLEALRFAQEIILYITAVLDDTSMPDRDFDSVAAHLEIYRNKLQTFTHERVFDLYSQSPWVCGAQMLEMLRMASYYGLRLLSYEHRVGAILHCYNIIYQFTNFERIDVLEYLIDALGTNFFPGGRPTGSFRNCATTFCGGRLDFEHNSTHRSGRHRMVIPGRHQATDGSGLRVEANDDRFSFSNTSWFFDVVTKLDYHLNQAEWELVDEKAKEMLTACRALPKDSAMVKTVLRYEDYIDAPSHRLQRLMQMALFTDFSDYFPVARINYFKLFTACTKIIGIVSDRSHPSEQGLMCQCFWEKLTVAADAYQRNNGKQPFGHRALVKNISDALTEVLRDSKRGDFLWQNV